MPWFLISVSLCGAAGTSIALRPGMRMLLMVGVLLALPAAADEVEAVNTDAAVHAEVKPDGGALLGHGIALATLGVVHAVGGGVMWGLQNASYSRCVSTPCIDSTGPLAYLWPTLTVVGGLMMLGSIPLIWLGVDQRIKATTKQDLTLSLGPTGGSVTLRF